MSREKINPTSNTFTNPTGITKINIGKVQGGRVNPTLLKPPPIKKK